MGSFKKLSSDGNVLHLTFRSSVDLYISEAWGTEAPNSRENLQQFIERQNSSCCSISHTPGMGGVLFSSSFCGFDIECTDRVSEKIAQRVSSSEEWESFLTTQQSPSYLWCAKESAWKSLRGRGQPSTISEVGLKWSSFSESFDFEFSFFCFEIESVKGQKLCSLGKGVVFEHEHFTLSLVAPHVGAP